VIILKEERVREIRNLAEQDELLQKIIDEIFQMANTELEQPLQSHGHYSLAVSCRFLLPKS